MLRLSEVGISARIVGLIFNSSRTVYVAKRENPIVNRLNKTKIERQVDHEQERIDRVKAENAVRRAAAAQKVRYPDYGID